MPPKAKFTRTEIVDTALQIVREQGIEAVTARELGRRLKSSACPVFTVFANMEEVHGEVIRGAKKLYKEYVDRGLACELPFRGVGLAYIAFAREEPRLFRLLFMEERTEGVDVGHILPLIDESYERILDSVRSSYGLPAEEAAWIYRHLWVYTHGIGTLCATGVCEFSGEEIQRMMAEVFRGLLMQRRNEERRRENDPD